MKKDKGTIQQGGPEKGKNEDTVQFRADINETFNSLRQTIQNAQNGILPEGVTQQNILDSVYALTSFDPGKGESGLYAAGQIINVIQKNQNQLSIDEVAEVTSDARQIRDVFSNNQQTRDVARSFVYQRVDSFNKQKTALEMSKGDTSALNLPPGSRQLLKITNDRIGGKIQSVVGKKLFGETIAKKLTGNTISKSITGAITTALPFLAAFAPLIDKGIRWLAENLVWPLLKRSKEFVAGGLGLVGTGLLLGSPILVGTGIVTMTLGAGMGGTAAITAGVNTVLRSPWGLAGEALAALGVSFIGYVVVGSILTALTLFIINSGAYIVPPNSQGQLGSTDLSCAGTITGSCPIPNGEVYVGSFRGGDGPYAHGSDEYFRQGSNNYDPNNPQLACYPLPIPVEACRYNSDTTSNCYTPGASCPMYGYAADVRYTSKPTNCAQAVYLPQIGGQTLSWTRNPDVIGGNCGNGYTWTASNGTSTHEMLFMHLNPSDIQSGQSGQPIGSVLTYATNTCMKSATNEHTHIEWRINGEYVRPDNMCSGQSTVVTPTDPSTLQGRLYIFPVNDSTVDDILASESVSGLYQAQSPCDWAAQNGAEIAVNANFFISSRVARGIAGDNGNITSHTDATEFDFRTFYIEDDGDFGIDAYVTPEPGRADEYEFAVTGVLWDNYTQGGMSRSTSRVALALDGSNLALLVTQNGTPAQIRAYMNGRGYADNEFFMLDGGSSTTLCQAGRPVYRALYPDGATAVPVSLGFRQDIVRRAQVITVGSGLPQQP